MPSEVPAAVLFDLDGTLVDTEPHWWRATATVARGLGVDLGPDDEPDVLGRTVEHTAAHLLSRAPRDHDAGDTGDALTRAFAGELAHSFDVMPGATPLLRELTAARIPTALVTASPRSIAALVLPRLGHRFDEVVAAEDTRRGKPHPDPYLEAARRLGAHPSRCVALEDSPAGVTAASTAGCHVVVVTRTGLPTLREIRSIA
ncbi:HAD family phosphatase [Nonomuraea sp. C10]|nr:HAD family phosphatase [Nonomuraea sp. C10]